MSRTLPSTRHRLHRLQHRQHHRARHGPRGAGGADHRHCPGDQTGSGSMTKSGVIGLLGTAATDAPSPMSTGSRQNSRSDKTLLIRHAAAGLVDLAAEEPIAARPARRSWPRIRGQKSRALRAMQDCNVAMDTLVLACTHFPLLTESELSRCASATRGSDLFDGAERHCPPDRCIVTEGQEFLQVTMPDMADCHGQWLEDIASIWRIDLRKATWHRPGCEASSDAMDRESPRRTQASQRLAEQRQTRHDAEEVIELPIIGAFPHAKESFELSRAG